MVAVSNYTQYFVSVSPKSDGAVASISALTRSAIALGIAVAFATEARNLDQLLLCGVFMALQGVGTIGLFAFNFLEMAVLPAAF
jgi:hypothetical protein